MNNPPTGKLLVLGANGYIGRHLAAELITRKHNVLLADIHDASLDGHGNYVSLDIRNFDAVADILADVSTIFNFAGLTGTWDSFEKYKVFIEINEIGLLNLLEAVRRTEKNIKVVFPSTRLVYQGLTDTWLEEDNPKTFKTVYAMNKFAGENYLKMYRELFGVTYTVFRICVPYGNLLDEKLSYGTINHFISQAAKGEAITLFGDGSQKRTFVHIEDLINILIEGSFSSETDNRIFNIGGNNVLSLKEVAQSIAAKYGVAVNFVEWPRIAQALESGDTIFDSGKLDKLINYDWQHDFFAWLNGLSSQRD